MDTKRILARVYFDRGSHGFSEPYEPGKSIEQYKKEFKDETNKVNNTSSAIVAMLELTEHNPDGSYKVHKDGRWVTKIIYEDELFFKRLFPG